MQKMMKKMKGGKMKRLMEGFGGGGMPSMEDMDPRNWQSLQSNSNKPVKIIYLSIEFCTLFMNPKLNASFLDSPSWASFSTSSLLHT